jgi:hypothetical protein
MIKNLITQYNDLISKTKKELVKLFASSCDELKESFKMIESMDFHEGLMEEFESE